jgi:hypothetical protein
MNAIEIQAEALSKAINGQSLANYPTIIEGFMAKGIPEDQIKPRENVFSFNAWKALGRYVRRGEHGVKIGTIRAVSKTDRATGEKTQFKMPWSVTVFHISQTDEMAKN